MRIRRTPAPSCGGELREVIARRQELLPEKFTRKKEADKKLHDEIRERERGDYVEPSDISVREYLIDHWLPTLETLELRPNTKLALGLPRSDRHIPYAA